jgi:hypothetical protein
MTAVGGKLPLRKLQNCASFPQRGSSLSIRTEALLLVAVSALLVILALKWGFIGGGGTGAERTRNPVNFWLGVGLTTLMGAISLGIFVSTFIR